MPRPPMSVPSTRAFPLSVNPDSSTAAGTLLITWLARRAVRNSRPSRNPISSCRKAGTWPRFPISTKKATKVASRGRSTHRNHRGRYSRMVKVTTPRVSLQSMIRATVRRHRRNRPPRTRSSLTGRRFPFCPASPLPPFSRGRRGIQKTTPSASRTREARV